MTSNSSAKNSTSAEASRSFDPAAMTFTPGQTACPCIVTSDRNPSATLRRLTKERISRKQDAADVSKPTPQQVAAELAPIAVADDFESFGSMTKAELRAAKKAKLSASVPVKTSEVSEPAAPVKISEDCEPAANIDQAHKPDAEDSKPKILIRSYAQAYEPTVEDPEPEFITCTDVTDEEIVPNKKDVRTFLKNNQDSWDGSEHIVDEHIDEFVFKFGLKVGSKKAFTTKLNETMKQRENDEKKGVDKDTAEADNKSVDEDESDSKSVFVSTQEVDRQAELRKLRVMKEEFQVPFEWLHRSPQPRVAEYVTDNKSDMGKYDKTSLGKYAMLQGDSPWKVATVFTMKKEKTAEQEEQERDLQAELDKVTAVKEERELNADLEILRARKAERKTPGSGRRPVLPPA